MNKGKIMFQEAMNQMKLKIIKQITKKINKSKILVGQILKKYKRRLLKNKNSNQIIQQNVYNFK